MKGPLNISPLWAFTFLGTLIYPLLVYRYIAVSPPALFAGFALILIAIRMVYIWHLPGSSIWLGAFIFAALIFVFIMLLSTSIAVKAYPIIISLSFAGAFGFSLVYPPTIVERFARITHPDLPPSGVAYTKKVTIVWLIFLICNAAISAVTALWGSLELWTLWNGLISYLIMGILFAVEYAFRRRVMK